MTSTLSLLHLPRLTSQNLPHSSSFSTLVFFTMVRWTSREREGLGAESRGEWEATSKDEMVSPDQIKTIFNQSHIATVTP